MKALRRKRYMRIRHPIALRVRKGRRHLRLGWVAKGRGLHEAKALESLVLQDLLFFPTSVCLQGHCVIVIRQNVFAQDFFIVFQFINIRFQGHCVIMNRVMVVLFDYLFLWFFPGRFHYPPGCGVLVGGMVAELLVGSTGGLPVEKVEECTFARNA